MKVAAIWGRSQMTISRISRVARRVTTLEPVPRGTPRLARAFQGRPAST